MAPSRLSRVPRWEFKGPSPMSTRPGVRIEMRKKENIHETWNREENLLYFQMLENLKGWADCDKCKKLSFVCGLAFAPRCKSLGRSIISLNHLKGTWTQCTEYHRIIRVSYSYELSADPMVAMTDSGTHLLQIMRWRVILASTTCTTMARQMTWDRTLRLEFDGPGGPSHGHSHLLDLWNVLHASLYSLIDSIMTCKSILVPFSLTSEKNLVCCNVLWGSVQAFLLHNPSQVVSHA